MILNLRVKGHILPENIIGRGVYFDKVLRLRINGRFLDAPSQTGVQRWAKEVLLELQASSAVDIEILKPTSYFRSGMSGHIWEQFVLPMLGNRSRPLVSLANWGPYFTRNQVLVVHDLIPLKNPSLFKKSYTLACKFLLPRIVHRSKVVCVPSLETANEISESLGVASDKVKVIGAGIRFNELFLSEKYNHPLDFKYFVFLGGFNSRKNLDFLLKFWSQLNDQKVKLVVVARSTERVTTQAITRDLNPSVVLMTDPDDDLLFSLYRNSIALLFPSISEGFGLPLLEVMSTGKPFISNQVGVAKELCIGDSSVVELNQEVWLKEINRLASKLSVCDEEQISLARQYNWKRVANKLIENIVD
jgi:glycosyltransferase involved in cell wall biosynthesis